MTRLNWGRANIQGKVRRRGTLGVGSGFGEGQQKILSRSAKLGGRKKVQKKRSRKKSEKATNPYLRMVRAQESAANRVRQLEAVVEKRKQRHARKLQLAWAKELRKEIAKLKRWHDRLDPESRQKRLAKISAREEMRANNSSPLIVEVRRGGKTRPRAEGTESKSSNGGGHL
jgi:hypothetical protein